MKNLMTLLSHFIFILARRQQDQDWADAFIERKGQKTFKEKLQGKNIALVGNAQLNQPHSYSKEIDNHDIVIRMNSAPGVGMEGRGSKINWLATSIPPDLPDGLMKQLDLILWMSNKRRKLSFQLWRSDRIAFYPATRNHLLRETLGARPSTGAMLIDLMLDSKAARITLYGFDFFQTPSLSGHANFDTVPHDFEAEKIWVMSMAKADPRLIIRNTKESEG